MSIPQSSSKAIVNITTATTTTIVAGQPGRRIYIWQFFFVNGHASTDVSVTLNEGSTAISGAYLIKAAGGSHSGLCSGLAWASTAPGDSFTITTSAAGSLQGTVYYTIE